MRNNHVFDMSVVGRLFFLKEQFSEEAKGQKKVVVPKFVCKCKLPTPLLHSPHTTPTKLNIRAKACTLYKMQKEALHLRNHQNGKPQLYVW